MTAEEFTIEEERLNAVTHAAGALLAAIGLIWLLLQALHLGQAGSLAASAVYGSALVLLYVFSSLHHTLRHPRAKQVFLAFDHCGIYLLIAGTYTPFSLLMTSDEARLLLSFVWGAAALGITIQMTAFLAGRSDDYERFAFVFYLAMGWVPLLWIGNDIWNALAPAGLALLVAGGIAYSTGVIFYLWKSLFHNHAVWHLFVIAGSVLQFFSILFYVVPGRV